MFIQRMRRMVRVMSRCLCMYRAHDFTLKLHLNSLSCVVRVVICGMHGQGITPVFVSAGERGANGVCPGECEYRGICVYVCVYGKITVVMMGVEISHNIFFYGCCLIVCLSVPMGVICVGFCACQLLS